MNLPANPDRVANILVTYYPWRSVLYRSRPRRTVTFDNPSISPAGLSTHIGRDYRRPVLNLQISECVYPRTQRHFQHAERAPIFVMRSQNTIDRESQLTASFLSVSPTFLDVVKMTEDFDLESLLHLEQTYVKSCSSVQMIVF
jgi:hypothetical protein